MTVSSVWNGSLCKTNQLNSGRYTTKILKKDKEQSKCGSTSSKCQINNRKLHQSFVRVSPKTSMKLAWSSGKPKIFLIWTSRAVVMFSSGLTSMILRRRSLPTPIGATVMARLVSTGELSTNSNHSSQTTS